YGFWGELPASMSFSELAEGVRSLFNIDGFLMTDPPPRKIRRIAFVAGKGAAFIPSAVSHGCDVFITGEAGYHFALEGARRGMAVMELGHRESELFFVRTMQDWIAKLGLRTTALTSATQKIWTD